MNTAQKKGHKVNSRYLQETTATATKKREKKYEGPKLDPYEQIQLLQQKMQERGQKRPVKGTQSYLDQSNNIDDMAGSSLKTPSMGQLSYNYSARNNHSMNQSQITLLNQKFKQLTTIQGIEKENIGDSKNKRLEQFSREPFSRMQGIKEHSPQNYDKTPQNFDRGGLFHIEPKQNSSSLNSFSDFFANDKRQQKRLQTHISFDREKLNTSHKSHDNMRLQSSIPSPSSQQLQKPSFAHRSPETIKHDLKKEDSNKLHSQRSQTHRTSMEQERRLQKTRCGNYSSIDLRRDVLKSTDLKQKSLQACDMQVEQSALKPQVPFRISIDRRYKKKSFDESQENLPTQVKSLQQRNKVKTQSLQLDLKKVMEVDQAIQELNSHGKKFMNGINSNDYINNDSDNEKDQNNTSIMYSRTKHKHQKSQQLTDSLGSHSSELQTEMLLQPPTTQLFRSISNAQQLNQPNTISYKTPRRSIVAHSLNSLDSFQTQKNQSKNPATNLHTIQGLHTDHSRIYKDNTMQDPQKSIHLKSNKHLQYHTNQDQMVQKNQDKSDIGQNQIARNGSRDLFRRQGLGIVNQSGNTKQLRPQSKAPYSRARSQLSNRTDFQKRETEQVHVKMLSARDMYRKMEVQDIPDQQNKYGSQTLRSQEPKPPQHQPSQVKSKQENSETLVGTQYETSQNLLQNSIGQNSVYKLSRSYSSKLCKNSSMTNALEETFLTTPSRSITQSLMTSSQASFPEQHMYMQKFDLTDLRKLKTQAEHRTLHWAIISQQAIQKKEEMLQMAYTDISKGSAYLSHLIQQKGTLKRQRDDLKIQISLIKIVPQLENILVQWFYSNESVNKVFIELQNNISQCLYYIPIVNQTKQLDRNQLVKGLATLSSKLDVLSNELLHKLQYDNQMYFSAPSLDIHKQQQESTIQNQYIRNPFITGTQQHIRDSFGLENNTKHHDKGCMNLDIATALPSYLGSEQQGRQQSHDSYLVIKKYMQQQQPQYLQYHQQQSQQQSIQQQQIKLQSQQIQKQQYQQLQQQQQLQHQHQTQQLLHRQSPLRSGNTNKIDKELNNFPIEEVSSTSLRLVLKDLAYDVDKHQTNEQQIQEKKQQYLQCIEEETAKKVELKFLKSQIYLLQNQKLQLRNMSSISDVQSSNSNKDEQNFLQQLGDIQI